MASEPARMLRPGAPTPLGASFDGHGVNFALVSAHATRVQLCLFDQDGRERHRLTLPERTGHVRHGYLPGIGPGQAYGFRVHGPFAPEEGHRFNPAKLLLDPYAKALTGPLLWDDRHLGYPADDPAADLALDMQDNAAVIAKSVVTLAPPPFAGARPDRAWSDTVLYEAHVKGLTQRHPGVAAERRGRFAGLAEPAVLDHLVRLGITAIELLPVAAFLPERRLVRMGLTNYWGYNPLAFLVPEPRYALADPTAELRTAVDALHGAGIEVILDVVFNHTAESDELGPTLSFRGIDNALYYKLRPDRPRYYVNHAGTGNILDTGRPEVIAFVMDTLRWWVERFAIDGFRFDLAPVLGRDGDDFSTGAALLDCMRQDPLLAGVKLIAEPWDIGPGGYQLGRFPAPFAEWNDRFRDTVRRFWRGDEGIVPALAGRLLGSADTFDHAGRRAWSSVNFVTSHDGFTLADLVTYEHKRNEANGEGNRDGHGENLGHNHGVEGPSDDPAIAALRLRQQRNLLATLILAQGTPMLLMGDEIGHSQQGNNNAYCQDNELTWLDWQADAEASPLQRFTALLTALRARHPALRRRRFLHGRESDAAGRPDVGWIAESGLAMGDGDWQERSRRTIGLLLASGAGPEPARDGEVQPGSTLLWLLHSGAGPTGFVLPASAGGWSVVLDSASEDGSPRPDATFAGGTPLTLGGRSVLLLEERPAPPAS